MPEIAAAVNAQGNEIPMLSPAETDKFVRGELEKWRKVIAAAGIKPD
jgi:tripartite-type tricarboxylate transporter receptor subunit TctC